MQIDILEASKIISDLQYEEVAGLPHAYWSRKDPRTVRSPGFGDVLSYPRTCPAL
jgi:hypothetical protein